MNQFQALGFRRVSKQKKDSTNFRKNEHVDFIIKLIFSLKFGI